jgi:integrase
MSRGHVRKRGAVWYVVVERPRDPATGKRRQEWVRTAARTKKEAEVERTRLLREQDSGLAVEPHQITVGEWMERWLAGERHLRPSTRENYRIVLDRHIIPDLGGLRLAALSPVVAREWQARLWGKGLGDSRVSNIWVVLHAALKDALRLQLIPRNPCDAVSPPRRKRAERPVWDEAQARRFRALIRGDRFEAAYLLAMGTGLRKGEILGLRWQDLDLARRTLVVRQQFAETKELGVYADEPKTASGRRRLTMPGFAAAALAAHCRRQDAERAAWGEAWDDRDLVFPRPGGGPMTAATLDWAWLQLRRRVLIPAGLPDARFHDLRHCHATIGLERGIHPKAMSARLGHHSVSFTLDRYVHATAAMEERIAEEFDRAFADADAPGDRAPGDEGAG